MILSIDKILRKVKTNLYGEREVKPSRKNNFNLNFKKVKVQRKYVLRKRKSFFEIKRKMQSRAKEMVLKTEMSKNLLNVIIYKRRVTYYKLPKSLPPVASKF